jgi:DNA repair protein RecO (recombination protein O)
MIVRTDAVILRTFDYGETSRIVTLLTRTHGVVGGLARGARRPKSTFGSTLQPMAHVQAVFYHRAGRGLQTLKEASHVTRFRRLDGRDLDRVTLGLRAVEVTRAVIDEGDTHPLALDLLVAVLSYIDAAEERVANGLLWFQLRLATLLGFAPSVDREDVLALDDRGVLLLDRGSVRPAPDDEPGVIPSGAAVPASRAALRAFAIFARTDLSVSSRLDLDPEVLRETEGLIEGYLRHHTDSRAPERVRSVADQLEAGLARSGTSGRPM